MVWGGRAVAVAAMVGYEAAAASVGRLLADSISLLGHEAGAASPPRTSYFDAAFPRQAAFEPMTLHQFFARSELVSRRERGVFPRHEKTVIGNLREVAERLAPGRACIPVVPDHGSAKTGASLNLFPAFRNAGPPDSGAREVAAGTQDVLDFSSTRCSLMASVIRYFAPLCAITVLASMPSAGQQAGLPPTTEGDFVVKNFQFRSGESLPELRLHYTTLGKPVRNAEGRVTNAVLILHGTGGAGSQFLQPVFAGELFGPGQLLDATRYFIILLDGIGHGKSSKPSDGLHARFPQYDYD